MNAMPIAALVLGFFVSFSGSHGWAATMAETTEAAASRVGDTAAQHVVPEAAGGRQVWPSRLRFRQGPVCMCESGLSEKDIQHSGALRREPPVGSSSKE